MENNENYSYPQDAVELRHLRNFNEVINATFNFVKQDYVRLFRVLLYYLGPIILIQAIAGAYYQASILNLPQSVGQDGGNPFALFQNMFTTEYYILIIASVIGSVLNISIIYSYFKLYDIRGKDGFEHDDVWREAMSNFLNVFLTSIVVGTFIFIGLFLFLIPGIYIFVPFSLMFAIRIIEGHGMGDSFNRAFYLVKNNWWTTFGIIFIVTMIAYFAGLIFTLPQAAFSMWDVFTSVSEGGEKEVSILYMVLLAFGQFFASLMLVLPQIAIGFQYFSLVEEKDSTNLHRDVETLGR